MKELKKHSVVYQMILIFFIVLLLPSVFVSILYYNITKVRYENEALQSFNIILDQYINSVSSKLERYRFGAEFLCNESGVKHLAQKPDPSVIFDISREYFKNVIHEGDIYRCTIYSQQLDDTSEYSFSRAKEEAWFREIVDKKRYGAYFLDKTLGMNIPLISLIYPIGNGDMWSNYDKPMALIKLDLFADNVLGSAFPDEWNDMVDCMVFSENKEIFFRTGDGAEALEDIVSDNDDIELIESCAKEAFEPKGSVLCKKLAEGNIYILCCTSRGYIGTGVRNDFILRVLRYVLPVGFLIVMIFIFMKSLTKKMNILLTKIKKISEMDFSECESIEGKDEFALIDKSLDVMRDKLDRLITDNYRQKLLRREAELRALYFQINPHFLYNTLESISQIAYIEGSENAAVMSQKLGALFRYSVSTGKEGRCLLRDEIKYINDYIEIQNIRFDDTLSLITDIPEELMGSEILKFSLQPLIENAVKYAFVPKTKGIIKVKAFIRGKDLIIEVSDDGKGMDRETLHEIKESLHCADWNSKKIGLHNLNSRLVLEYGEDHMIDIRSSPGQGTAITLKFLISGVERNV